MNGAQSELLLAVSRVVAAFDELGVEYLIGGSIASSVFGEPRQTVDADLLARLFGRHAEPLTGTLSAEFYADLPSIRSAIQSQGSFNLIHLETMTKVDVFVRLREPFAESQFARRQRKRIGEAEPLDFFFASAEDTVLAKLEWYYKGGSVSEQQWRDVLGVLKVQGRSLDQAYLNRWAQELGIAGLLERALLEAGLAGPSATEV